MKRLEEWGIDLLPLKVKPWLRLWNQSVLWKLIFIKLFIMFGILKIFFFPDFLATNFSNDAERADHVLQNLTRIEVDAESR